MYLGKTLPMALDLIVVKIMIIIGNIQKAITRCLLKSLIKKFEKYTVCVNAKRNNLLICMLRGHSKFYPKKANLTQTKF